MSAARIAERGLTRRLAAAFVLALMLAGCLALWIGAPIGGMWAAAKLTDSAGLHLAAAIVLAAAGMIVVAIALVWVESLYLRITAGPPTLIGDSPVERRGPLEPMLIACLVAAVVAFALWFFLLAENPTVNLY